MKPESAPRDQEPTSKQPEHPSGKISRIGKTGAVVAAGVTLSNPGAAIHEAGSAARTVAEGGKITEVATDIGMSEAAILKQDLEDIVRKHHPSAKVEVSNQVELAGSKSSDRTENPSESPWLNHLSDQQAETVESFSSLTPEKKQFLEQMIFQARRLVAEGRKINAPVMVAQAALEGGWANAKGLDNWGIKMGDYQGGSQVYEKAAEWDEKAGELKTQPDNFREYTSIEEAANNYATFVEHHFPDAAAHCEDPYEYIHGLLNQSVTENDGTIGTRAYATAPDYGQNLIDIVENYQLQELTSIPTEKFVP